MSNSKYPPQLVAIAIAASFVGIFLSILFIHPAKKVIVNSRSAAAVPQTFPDVNNDPLYKNFLNKNAIDPTQALPAGGSGNSTPFGG